MPSVPFPASEETQVQFFKPKHRSILYKCEQKTVTQVESNIRIMSGAVEWLWEFKRKLDSTITPTGGKINSAQLQKFTNSV